MNGSALVVVAEQREQWQKALDRAREQNLTLRNRQTRYDGLAKITSVTVSSSREGYGPYTVTVRRDNGVYTVACTCEARGICKHRALGLLASGDFDLALHDPTHTVLKADFLLAPRLRKVAS